MANIDFLTPRWVNFEKIWVYKNPKGGGGGGGGGERERERERERGGFHPLAHGLLVMARNEPKIKKKKKNRLVFGKKNELTR